ncbi:hypothetical protein [Pseudooceanicola nitratireducens]|jgi:hypothetical protein|uniref:hypothetical protein n=1 Tax=Pseudooceanicola nitratireducens TaxID=517719 RepID=UPI003516E692
MKKSDFAQLVADRVHPPSKAESLLRFHENPPGRGVTAERRALAAWISALPQADRANVLHLMDDAIQSAIFGLLVLLDEGEVYRDGEVVGEVRLDYCATTGEVTRLNTPEGEDLHDLYSHALKDRTAD